MQSPSWPGRERDQLPARSTLSRFLAALTSEPVQALRTLFLDDLLSRPLAYAKQTGGLVDRAGHEWVVFDSDGTREAARVSRLAPRQKNCPLLFAGWMTSVPLATGGASAGKSCVLAPSSVRPTVESRLGSFGNRGNGLYRVELRQALATIGRYHGSRTSSRRSAPCSGSTDNMARGPCSPRLSGFASVPRGKEYAVLNHPVVQARLHLPKDSAPAASGKSGGAQPLRLRLLYLWGLRACRAAWWWRPIQLAKRRVRLASRVRASSTNSSSPACESQAFTASDIVELYLHRGAFEPVLADEDEEQDERLASVVCHPLVRSAGSWFR